MRVGIVTFHSSHNYGGALQTYALFTVLSNLGCEVKIIDRRWGSYTALTNRPFVTAMKKIVTVFKNDVFEEFYNRYYVRTKHIRSQEELRALNEDFDIVVVGSDQVWNSDIIRTMGYYYFLDWLDPQIKRITYAVSFGKDSFDVSETELMKVKALVSQFSTISVRESSGVDLCTKYFNVAAEQHIDPTLLLSLNEYKTLALPDPADRPYVIRYILDASEEKEHITALVSREKGVQVKDLHPTFKGSLNAVANRVPMIAEWRFPIMAEWLNRFYHASFIVTDSFHGVIFAILFQKDFICIKNEKRGSARFESLLSLFQLNHRMVTNISEIDASILSERIDYRATEGILAEEQKRARAYIRSQLTL
jgi:polysaccharide pyruvyl transferase WcaK-like protein